MKRLALVPLLADRDRWDTAEPLTHEVTTCRNIETLQTRVVGYQVTYDYRGRRFTTPMDDNPGPCLKVRVSADPVGR